MTRRHGSETMPADVDSGSRDDLTRANGNCPLCWDDEIMSSHQYQSHVGHHLEQLALFVLPGAEEQIKEEETETSQNESHNTEDEDWPTLDYEQEKGVLLSGSASPNAINMLDANQIGETGEDFIDIGGFKVSQAGNDEFRSTFAEYIESPSTDDGNSTLQDDSLALPAVRGGNDILLTEQQRKTAEEAGKLKRENERLLKLEKQRLDAEEEKNHEEATKRESKMLLKMIEEETILKYETEARLKLMKEHLNEEEARNIVMAAKKESKELMKKVKEESMAKEAEEAQRIKEEAKAKLEAAKKAADNDDEEPIKFKDAVGRNFKFPWSLCSTWTVSISSHYLYLV